MPCRPKNRDGTSRRGGQGRKRGPRRSTAVCTFKIAQHFPLLEGASPCDNLWRQKCDRRDRNGDCSRTLAWEQFVLSNMPYFRRKLMFEPGLELCELMKVIDDHIFACETYKSRQVYKDIDEERVLEYATHQFHCMMETFHQRYIAPLLW